jgi:NCS2 family nucleobase:cation symporter-2
MRKEVVTRATDAVYEVINNLSLLQLRSEVITLRTSWDELRLDLDIEYAGPAIELANSVPTVEELGTETGAAHLAGYLIRQYADRVKIREKNGACRVQLHFDH